MTPFGIRKRLKKRLQGGGEEIQRCTITYVLPDGSERSVECEERYTLLMAADENRITISTGRRAGGTCPDGQCGLCRLEILDASGLNALSEFEIQVMDDHTAGTPHEGRPREAAPPRGPNTRLGCHAKVLSSGARIQIPELFDPDSIKGTE